MASLLSRSILPASLLLTIFHWPIKTSAQVSIRTCYWPDGNTTTITGHNFRSCDVNGPYGVSHCCNMGEACLDNSLCFGASVGVAYRGARTDGSWNQNTTACPKYCMESETWANMLPCKGVPQVCCQTTSDAEYCKSGNGGEVFEYEPGRIMFVVNTTSATTTPSASGTASSTADMGRTSCTGTSAEDSCVAPAVPVGVGVGVGVPLLLACAVLGWLLVRERKNRNIGGAGGSKVEEPLSYVAETKDTRSKYGTPSPAPACAPRSARDESDQARMMQQQRAESEQHLSELETERGRAELGQ